MRALLPGKIVSVLLGGLLIFGTAGDITPPAAAQTNPEAVSRQYIAGNVSDLQGGAIAGAQVTITDSSGTQTSLRTDSNGKFSFAGISPDMYSIRISAPNFNAYEDAGVRVVAGRDYLVAVSLTIAPRKEEITVLAENPLARGAEYSGGQFILRSEALDLFLSGPGELEAMLRALALRSAGPFGPHFVIDGFEDMPFPAPESIREIRINDNPFSAEYSRLGLGRIEILTKPGTSTFRTQVFFNFGDYNLNTRNPFAQNRARYQSRVYGGNISGPIVPKRATFFVDFNRQEADSNAVINATILGDGNRVIPFHQAVVTPERRITVSPRIDYQLSQSNTLVSRYSDSRSHASNSGLGDFSLPSRRQDTTARSRVFQLTETAILSSSLVNEVRLQYLNSRETRHGNNSVPVINVSGAFIGGGADIGSSYDRERRSELHDLISWRLGRHFLKFGVQAKYTQLQTGSTLNFGGTYTFNGRLAPELDAEDAVVTDSTGSSISVPITSIEAYRRTTVFRSKGFAAALIRQLGGGPSQFSLTAGTAEAHIAQFQIAGFVQDDWRVRPDFSLNLGVRYEYQDTITHDVELAPRVAFAWGIGRGKDQPRTVIRGGAGVFYEPVDQRLSLRARQINGRSQRQFFVSDPSILDLFPTVPSAETLTSFAVAQSKVQLARDLRMPYSAQASISVERQLPRGVSAAATYSRLRAIHLLRSRNVNAPVRIATNPNAVRPVAAQADIFQYESSGVSNQHQLLVNLIFRVGKQMTLWTTYTNTHSNSDSDGPETFPASSYDLNSEYGRSSADARHTIYAGGWIRVKGGIEFTPLVIWRSATFFNITTGQDNNGDSLFLDRPTFATDFTRPSVVRTRFGSFDLNPIAGQQMIPRNLGVGPEFFIVNLRASKRIPFNERHSVVLSVQAQNLFNHTNPGIPVGNLSSPLFGISHSSAGDWGFGSNQAGNRRLDFSLSFSF